MNAQALIQQAFHTHQNRALGPYVIESYNFFCNPEVNVEFGLATGIGRSGTCVQDCSSA